MLINPFPFPPANRKKTSNKNTHTHTQFLIFVGENDWTPWDFFCVKSCCFKTIGKIHGQGFTLLQRPATEHNFVNLNLYATEPWQKTMGSLKMGHDLPGELFEKIQENNSGWKLHGFFLGWKISTWSLYKKGVSNLNDVQLSLKWLCVLAAAGSPGEYPFGV